ncbi:NADH:flavin oxidoreductase/NADH oxidase [Microlunatus soli]|uniref:2,4-dienoyl-CoA reductase n=1 Tax=Microlunatus soli TaxID=630515 RepID=A0A1H1ZHI4_9ACTN|nr:NADH:flavin oxidoreductase/NADH oxidase [Microlunatus soli]SDT33103.1 2,4-dienoyl-CoA reductase [Microlunatus soli]
MSLLFEPYQLRSVTFPNRIWVAPMCQYSAASEGTATGVPNDWHFAHLAARATGGAGLVMTEATAVSAVGRISPQDLGIWNDQQADAFTRITSFIGSQGAVPAIQLAHAGRKASTAQPWNGGGPVGPDDGGWQPVGPSPVPFSDGFPTPHELTVDEIAEMVAQFRTAAARALAAGFRVAEVHGAHGYLVHQFLSPVSNRRTDDYGGSFDNRIRLALEITDAVRSVWPEELPVLFRVSATDWLADGAGPAWTADETVELARRLKQHGVDLIDTSSGGNVAGVSIPLEPGYQVPFASRIRDEAGIPAGAVGLITEPVQAEKIIADGEADVILLARELLRDPYWPLHAARELGGEIRVPEQYARAF